MICVKVDIPQSVCDIDDELKAIYHSKDSVYIWVFKKSEKKREYQKEWYLKNRDQKIQKSLKWTEENPEQRRLYFKNMFRIILQKLNSGNITTSQTICNWNGLRILDGWKHSIHQKENYQNDLLLKLQTSKSLTL